MIYYGQASHFAEQVEAKKWHLHNIKRNNSDVFTWSFIILLKENCTQKMIYF